MTKAISTPISSYEPVEAPALPHTPAIPIATLPGGLLIEAIPFKAAIFDGYLLRQRDPAKGLIRESTGIFRSPRDCSQAWFAGEEIEWEAWTSPLFASFGEAA